jgi:hypothetical protein
LARIARIAVVSVVFLLLAAGLALADTYTCTTAKCDGTNKDDTITGTDRSQTFFGQAGGDTLRDTAGDDADTIYGEDGGDRLNDADGDGRDTIRGGAGYDVCIGDRQDTFRGCEDIRIR